MSVLFLCQGNSARSQIAEAGAKQLSNGRFLFASAGTFPTRDVHTLAVQVMAKVGIDLSTASPKSFSDLPKPIHVIVAVSVQSEKELPTWPGLEVEARMIEDPARVVANEESQLPAFRATRERLRELVEDFLSRHEGDQYEEKPLL